MKIKNKVAAALFALVACLGLVVATAPGAAASASVSNADGKMSGQKAAAADPGYYGNLWAYPTACVVAERKTEAGHWVRTGFSQGSIVFDEFRVCYDSTQIPEAWRVHFNQGYTVTGLRFVSNQGLIKVLCDGNCATLLA